LFQRGADVLDIGAESTRPGSSPIGSDEQWARLEPIIAPLVRNNKNRLFSIDTRCPKIAAQSLELGADIINDVTGFQNPNMLKQKKKTACGLIAMRIRLKEGKIVMPEYLGPSPGNLEVVIQELRATKERILAAGIEPERVILDPGFGFGTAFMEDQMIWDALPSIPSLLAWPIERFCIGISRKRFVAHKFGVKGNKPLDEKTILLNQEAAMIGYKLFRVHAPPRR
jgi:dihydropteroate synthase